MAATATTIGHALSAADWLDTHYLAGQPEYEAMLRCAGCGGGSFLPLLSALLEPAGCISAIDLVPKNVAWVAARTLAERMNLPGRVDFRTADLLTDDFGVAQFDLCLLGQITDYLTPAQNQNLFQRVHTAQRPNGLMVLDAPMSGEQATEWTQIVSLLLWANGGGGTHTFDEYRAWLEMFGFTHVRKLSERWTAAHSKAAAPAISGS